MGLLSKLAGTTKEHEFVDLREHQAPAAATGLTIKVCELRQAEDVRKFAELLYDGHMLLLDFTAVAGDEIALKRITVELKRVVDDVGGDLAGYGQHTLIVTPTGVAVDRAKVRVA